VVVGEQQVVAGQKQMIGVQVVAGEKQMVAVMVVAGEKRMGCCTGGCWRETNANGCCTGGGWGVCLTKIDKNMSYSV
jgi:hypothetical protein